MRDATADQVSLWPDILPAVALEHMAQGGTAIGRYQGRVVFVRGGMPGEVVSVRLTRTRQRYAHGVVEAIHQPAPDRVEPPCPLFDRCGGCQWQYIAYPAQLAFKAAILRDQCQRLGKIEAPPVGAPLGMDTPWAYRSTATLHVSARGQVGYCAWHSHAVVPVEHCPLLVPALNALLSPLATLIPDLAPDDRPTEVTVRYSWAEQRCLLLLHGGSAQGSARLGEQLASLVPEIAWQRGRQVHILAGRGFLHETLGGLSLRLSPTSFFQVNVPQTHRLLQQVRTMLDLRPGDHLLDAYAGVGALSLPLASQGQAVTAIEAHPAAVRDLQANAHRLGLTQVKAIHGPVEKVLPGLGQTLDLVIVDPPRRGCLPDALEAVWSHRPRRIVYVSCHPGTLARDLGKLSRQGYRLARIVPVDLFPQTFHVESVSLLERVTGGPP